MSATVHSLHPKSAASRKETLYALSTATVLGHEDTLWLLDHPSRPAAQLSLSCLLAPEVGDTVLFTHPSEGEGAYVLAVLHRPQPDTGRLHLPGGNHLTSSSAGLQLHGASLSLNAAQQLQLNSADLDVNAGSAAVRVKHWQGWFDTAETHAVNVKLTAKTLSSRVGRLIQRLMESFRQTEGLDETRAGRVRVTADHHHQVEAGHLTHTAKGFVKIDGQKIDLG